MKLTLHINDNKTLTVRELFEKLGVEISCGSSVFVNKNIISLGDRLIKTNINKNDEIVAAVQFKVIQSEGGKHF